MLASTLKLRPRNFLIVLALAGDSTITRLVVPLVTGPFLALAEEARVDEVREVVDLVALVDLAVVLAAALRVVLPVFFVVVAI